MGTYTIISFNIVGIISCLVVIVFFSEMQGAVSSKTERFTFNSHFFITKRRRIKIKLTAGTIGILLI